MNWLRQAEAWAAEVEVRMKDGVTSSAYVDILKGDDICRPLTGEVIREKFRANVDFSRTVPGERAEKAQGMMKEALEGVSDIAEIIKKIS